MVVLGGFRSCDVPLERRYSQMRTMVNQTANELGIPFSRGDYHWSLRFVVVAIDIAVWTTFQQGFSRKPVSLFCRHMQRSLVAGTSKDGVCPF